jgi:hypothetical protein
MFRCIYSLGEFEKSNGEHILQNFLGARWVSTELVSDELQAEFGRTIDAALEKRLKIVRNLLGTLGGRGGDGPTLKHLSATTGEHLDLEPGGHPRLSRPAMQEKKLPSGQIRVSAQVANRQQFDWMLAEVRRRHPNAEINLEQAVDSARLSEGFIEGYVPFQIDIGGNDYFRGALKACFNLLGATHPEIAIKTCFAPVREFIKDGNGTAERFVRWVVSSDQLDVPQLGPGDQAIFIVTRDQSVEGVLQFFGQILHSFQLTDSYDGPSIQCGYIVDPFREASRSETRNPAFKPSSIPVFKDQSSVYSTAVQTGWETRLSRILDLYYSRSRSRMIEKTIAEVVQDHPGDVFTREMIEQIAQKLAQRFMRLPTQLKKKSSKVGLHSTVFSRVSNSQIRRVAHASALFTCPSRN